MNNERDEGEKVKRLVDIKTVKFLAVGIINTIFGTAVMFVCYNLFCFSYWVSSAANYILGSILSFFLNKYFTFQSKDRSGEQILRFIINIVCCYGFAYGCAKPLAAKAFSDFSLKIQENLAMMIGMGLFVVTNYLGQRYYVFKEEGDRV